MKIKATKLINEKETIQELYNGFEAAAVEVEDIECWSARELQLLLGYSKWENFSKVIDKAKIACEKAGSLVSDHFPDVRKKKQRASRQTASQFKKCLKKNYIFRRQSFRVCRCIVQVLRDNCRWLPCRWVLP